MTFPIFTIILTSLICFCRGPELSEELIKESDLIVEAKILSLEINDAREFSRGADVLIKLKAIKKFKGLKNSAIFYLNSGMGSCGFNVKPDKLDRRIGDIVLLYVKIRNNEYVYSVCSDRKITKPTKKYFRKKYGNYYFKQDIEYYNSQVKSYEEELVQLKKLLN